MTEKLKDLGDAIRTNYRWIILVIGGIVGLYLDSKYESKQSGDLSRTEIELIKQQLLLNQTTYDLEKIAHEAELKALTDRFEEKVVVLETSVEDVDTNENEIIRLKTIQDILTKIVIK